MSRFAEEVAVARKAWLLTIERLARRFAFSDRGNVSLIFVFASIPLLICAGAAIDLNRQLTASTGLQQAVDAAALRLGQMPAGTTQQVLNQMAQTWVAANLINTELANAGVKVVVNTSGDAVQVSAASVIPTSIIAMLGVPNMAVRASGTARFPVNYIELSLVLDNSNSMNQNSKLSNLRSAANTLINTLSSSNTAQNPNAFKVGVVPFSDAVNIGTSYNGSYYQNQSWMAATLPTVGYGGASFDSVNGLDRFAAFSKMQTAWGGCVESRPEPYDIQDTPPTASNPATLFVPFFAADEPDAGGTYSAPSSVNYRSFNDYEADNVPASNQNYFDHEYKNISKYSAPPSSGTAGYFNQPLGPNAGCALLPVLRMTNNLSVATNEINNMTSTSIGTAIPLGMIWGWHLISPNAPFADGQSYSATNVEKVIVLVTDGNDDYATNSNPNGSYYTSYGYQWQQRIQSDSGNYTTSGALDNRLTHLCANLRTAGVTVYVVPVDVTGRNAQNLLQGCATSPSTYLNVSSSQLGAAFQQIAASITNLRISQ